MNLRRLLPAAAAALAATMALTACGSNTDTASTGTESGSGVTKIIVGASPVPHAKILEFVRDNLAADAGLDIEIKEFDDYVLPNDAVQDGSIDANYFQHLPYLEQTSQERGYTFEHGDGIHIEPYALFSEKYDSADQIPDGGTIAITSDASNQYRALKVLESVGLLADISEDAAALTLTDEQNPKGLKFQESAPEVVVQQLGDAGVDAAMINGNFILTAGLDTDNAIASESVENNPYANILVWKQGSEKTDAVKKLDELLHSDKVKEFITTTWPSGDVLPS